MSQSATSVLIGFNPTISVPVTAFMFSGYEKIQVTFMAQFKRLSRKDNRTLQKEIVDAMRNVRKLSAELVELEKQADQGSDIRISEIDNEIDKLTDLMETRIKSHLIGWEDLKGHGDEVVAYSEDTLEYLLDNDAYFIALRDGLNKATGADYEVSERKNSSK